MVVSAQKPDVDNWQETDAVLQVEEADFVEHVAVPAPREPQMDLAARLLLMQTPTQRLMHQLMKPIVDAMPFFEIGMPLLHRERPVQRRRASLLLLDMVYGAFKRRRSKRRRAGRLRRRRQRALALIRLQPSTAAVYSRYSLDWSWRDDYEHLFFVYYVN